MKKIVLASAVALGLAASSSAMAGYTYASFGVGGSFAGDASYANVAESVKGTFDKKDTFAYHADVGYMVMPYFGVEGGVNKYADLQASLGGVDVGNLSQYGLNIMGVGVVPLGLFDIYAKAGLQFTNAKIALNIPTNLIVGNSDRWNTNFAFGFGAGVDFPLTPIVKLGMKAEYQHVLANKSVKTQFGPVTTSIDYPSNNIVFIAATVKFKGV